MIKLLAILFLTCILQANSYPAVLQPVQAPRPPVNQPVQQPSNFGFGQPNFLPPQSTYISNVQSGSSGIPAQPVNAIPVQLVPINSVSSNPVSSYPAVFPSRAFGFGTNPFLFGNAINPAASAESASTGPSRLGALWASRFGAYPGFTGGLPNGMTGLSGFPGAGGMASVGGFPGVGGQTGLGGFPGAGGMTGLGGFPGAGGMTVLVDFQAQVE